MNKRILLERLKQYITINKKGIIEESISVHDFSLMQFRDCLLDIGTILEEDLDSSIYVVRIPAGIADLNHATVAMHLNKNSIDCIGYAQEGLFNQHTAEKAVGKIRKRIFESKL